MAAKAQQFDSMLEKGERSLGWTIARVPFEPAKVWSKMVRLRVCGTICSAKGKPTAFRTSLFPDPRGGFYLLVNRAMQQGASVIAGKSATFSLEPDFEPREADLPDELAVLLDDEDGLRGWYEALGEYTRRELGKWVYAVKGDEARMHRAQQAAERLLSAMEGEKELPPMIAAAFRKRPKARSGWLKLTETQRRNELLAVFYYQSPEAREKRVAKLCDAAEKKA